MKTLTLNIPDSVILDDKEAIMLLSTKLYEQGKLSLGEAADFAGLSKREFTEILGKYGVSVFNYPSSDLAKDLSNA